jgi:hypothetical protein
VRVQVRVSLVALVVSALVILAAPVAAEAALGFESWFAGNCSKGHEECNKVEKPSLEPKKAREEEVEKAEKEGFTQAAGHPNFGITEFKIKTSTPAAKANVVVEGVKLAEKNELGMLAPEANVEKLRVDVAPGVVTNPNAVAKCTMEDFSPPLEVAKGVVIPGVYFEPTCSKGSIIGENKVKTAVEIEEGGFKGNLFDAELVGKVYNLEQPNGLGSDFGVALPTGKKFGGKELFVHTLIQGSVEWAGDFHDYFVIEGIPPGLISSRLTFFGQAGTGSERFLSNGATCEGPGVQTTTTIHGQALLGSKAAAEFETPIGASGCGKIPFAPTLALHPEATGSDQPNGITTELVMPHTGKPLASSKKEEEEIEEEGGIDSSTLKNATAVLPEGLTLNPSAAAGLRACTPKQAGITSETRALAIRELAPIGCPAASRIGSVNLEVPTLPAGSLQGSIFLGGGENAKGQAVAIEKPPYTIYVDAESARYGIRDLLKGTVQPDPATGRLTTTFTSANPAIEKENPQGPFNKVILHFNGGEFGDLANPLSCGSSKVTSEFTAFSGASPALPEALLTVENCASPAFAPKQATEVLPNAGGSESNFLFNLERPEGQQYVSKVSTLLPPGVVGKIPSVTQCTDAQAQATQESGTGCPTSSQVGTVKIAAGSGSPFTFSGKVYLTEKINGAPYGLAFKVPVEAGPFKFTEEVVIATININPKTAQVTVAATLPTIKDGIPIRMRSMTVDVNRPNYILNPTNCGAFETQSTVTSTLNTSFVAKSPFQVEGCSALPFKPGFTASTSGKASKPEGASLVTTMTSTPGQSNIKSVLVQLPKQLPSRLTTLQKACLAKTFEENPFNCSKESMVGTASAVTPVLPNVMKGPAILVSHAGEEFPSLELVLEADNVRVIVEGKTHITKGITTTNFAATPDVPVSSVTVALPLGPFSALALERPGRTNLCTEKLVMPTTITGQNGVVNKQNTIIAPSECGVQILKQKVRRNAVEVTLQTYAAGTVKLSGSGLKTTKRTYTGAKQSVTIKVPLSRGGHHRRRPFSVKVKVGFTPTQKGAASSASVSVRFKR